MVTSFRSNPIRHSRPASKPVWNPLCPFPIEHKELT